MQVIHAATRVNLSRASCSANPKEPFHRDRPSRPNYRRYALPAAYSIPPIRLSIHLIHATSHSPPLPIPTSPLPPPTTRLSPIARPARPTPKLVACFTTRFNNLPHYAFLSFCTSLYRPSAVPITHSINLPYYTARSLNQLRQDDPHNPIATHLITLSLAPAPTHIMVGKGGGRWGWEEGVGLGEERSGEGRGGGNR